MISLAILLAACTQTPQNPNFDKNVELAKKWFETFTSENFDCECKSIDTRPDIISFGKKTQVCGIFAGDRLNEVEGHVFEESSRLNSTWGGNLVDMVRFTV